MLRNSLIIVMNDLRKIAFHGNLIFSDVSCLAAVIVRESPQELGPRLPLGRSLAAWGDLEISVIMINPFDCQSLYVTWDLQINSHLGGVQRQMKLVWSEGWLCQGGGGGKKRKLREVLHVTSFLFEGCLVGHCLHTCCTVP